MKRKTIFLSIIAMLITIVACNNQTAKETTTDLSVKDTISDNKIAENTIQVYYFHGSIRCHTCVSVDENTHQYLKDLFPDKMENGEIIFKSINIDENESPDLVEKYQIYGQTLLFINGEKIIDETDDAFKYVITKPEKWKKIIEDVVYSFE